MHTQGAGRDVRLLHTSDLHIEEPADAACVSALAASARTHAADALLIVGDFFDHNRVTAETLMAVASALGELAIPVIVLPGNHDPAMEGSVYERGAFGAHVHVLATPGGAMVALPDLDLEAWGRPHASWDNMRPLADVPERGAAFWQIGLAHGHLTRGIDDIGRAYPIAPDEIAASGRDYIALGHWDVPSDASHGGVVAAYSGSASRVGKSALVTLTAADGRRRVSVETIAC